MKNKIITSYQNEETGYSYVAIQNKYGIFKGHSICSDEDLENYSRFAGERYAILRAEESFAKFRLKQEKIKLQAIRSLIKDIAVNVNYIPSDDPVMRRINLKIRDYTQSVSDWENLYNFYRQEVKHQYTLRQDILSKVKKK